MMVSLMAAWFVWERDVGLMVSLLFVCGLEVQVECSGGQGAFV